MGSTTLHFFNPCVIRHPPKVPCCYVSSRPGSPVALSAGIQRRPRPAVPASVPMVSSPPRRLEASLDLPCPWRHRPARPPGDRRNHCAAAAVGGRQAALRHLRPATAPPRCGRRDDVHAHPGRGRAAAGGADAGEWLGHLPRCARRPSSTTHARLYSTWPSSSRAWLASSSTASSRWLSAWCCAGAPDTHADCRTDLRRCTPLRSLSSTG